MTSISKTPEYQAWRGAISRCHQPGCDPFRRYAARGIRVCDAWRDSFEAFLAHVGHRPSARHSLDRIDNNRGYEPGNVRWATRYEQGGNRESSRRIEWRGECLHLAEWARRFGVLSVTLSMRLRRAGENVDAVFSEHDKRARKEAAWAEQMRARREERLRKMVDVPGEIPPDMPSFMHPKTACLWLESKGIFNFRLRSECP